MARNGMLLAGARGIESEKMTREVPDTAVMPSPFPVFSYWFGADLAPLQEVVTGWRQHFPQFCLHGDEEVLHLLQTYFPQHVEVYRRIRIPTARSDIALMLLLYEHGGLYVDCHCGPRDPDATLRLFTWLERYDAVVFDRKLKQEARPIEQHLFINSMILARPRFDGLLEACRQALLNFAKQYEDERRNKGFSPYDIWSLSGPGLLSRVLLEPASNDRDLRAAYANVKILREENSPVVRNMFRAYRSLSAHWSERQRSECLFENDAYEPSPSLTEFIERAVVGSEDPPLLRSLYELSFRVFGKVSAHPHYAYYYPWIAAALAEVEPGARLLDIGAGVSPLPCHFAERGALVDCVDNSPIHRVPPFGDDWNDWGYFDYATLHQNVTAHRCPIQQYQPLYPYQAIYSNTSLALFSAADRDATLTLCWQWLKHGLLALTLDLIPGTTCVWTKGGSHGETSENHGTLEQVVDKLRELGFEIVRTVVKRGIEGWNRTDLSLIVARKGAAVGD